MVTDVFCDSWITVEGSLVRMWVGGTGALGRLLLLRVSVMGRGKRYRRVLDPATGFVVGGWNRT